MHVESVATEVASPAQSKFASMMPSLHFFESMLAILPAATRILSFPTKAASIAAASCAGRPAPVLVLLDRKRQRPMGESALLPQLIKQITGPLLGKGRVDQMHAHHAGIDLDRVQPRHIVM